MACYEYHFTTFPFSRKNKISGGQVSDRSAAVIATSVLHDLGLVSPIDRSKVINRSKIRRERRTNRKELQLNGDQFDHYGIEGIFFHGRKDQILTQVLGVDNKYHRKTLTEEHLSIVSEPGSSYFSHTTSQSGSSKDITESLVASLKEVNAKTQNIKVVGCDGTDVNTGHTAGCIRRLEESFEHPVQWLVCLLPSNYLPVRQPSRHSTALLLAYADCLDLSESG